MTGTVTVAVRPPSRYMGNWQQAPRDGQAGRAVVRLSTVGVRLVDSVLRTAAP